MATLSNAIPKYKQRSLDTHNKTHLPYLESNVPDVILIGDSMFERFEWRDDAKAVWQDKLAKYNIGNFGVGGDKIENILYRIIDLGLLKYFKETPKKIIVMAGANDIERTPIGVMIDGINQIIYKLELTFPLAKFYVFGMLPRIADKIPEEKIFSKVVDFNNHLSKMNGITYSWCGDKLIDANNKTIRKYFVDNVHLNKEGYDIFADEIVKAIVSP